VGVAHRSTFDRLASPDLIKSHPYAPGLTVAEAAARYRVPVDRIIKLSSNENPIGPSPLAVEAAERKLPELHRYPDSTARELRSAISSLEQVREENVIVGAGSSELMSFVIRAFSVRGDEVLSLDPGFDVYAQIAVAEGRSSVRVSLDFPFLPTLQQFADKITPRTRVIFVTRPNNPTSRLLPIGLFLEIAQEARNAIVVSDEAYIEFADGYRRETAAPYALDRPNVLVSRTMSKAYGIPNARVGYMLGRPEAIAYLGRLKPIWNVGEVAQRAGIGALEDTAHLDETLRTVREGRAYLVEQLASRGLPLVPDPQANFVMVDVRPTRYAAPEFVDLIAHYGVLIRGDFHPDYVRISVGTAKDNRALIEAVDAVLAGLRHV
jgi:histidinol-phosphate aminotransferase